MVEYCRRKGTRYVTDPAVLGCRDVAHILAGGRGAVTGITSNTHDSGTGVVDKCRGKNSGVMAKPTILGCRDMTE